MTVVAYEGIVKKGKIHLKPGVRLPEEAKVFVIIPDATEKITARLLTPHLKNPTQAVDFEMEVSEDRSDAQL